MKLKELPEGYAVRFQHAKGYNWFYTFVLWEAKEKDWIIGEKSCCRNYTRASKWALKVVEDHIIALKILNGHIG